MRNYVAILVLCCVSVAYSQYPPQKFECGENEVYNPCQKPCVPGEMSYCYEYLRDQANECIPPATLPCEPVCDCKPGYLRKGGKCVLKQDCCDDPNEVVVECPDQCPATCENWRYIASYPCPKPCPVRGCTCKGGYVRDANNKCIPLETCPGICPNPNEEFDSCGTACEPYCGYQPEGCTKNCVIGCFCKKGFIRKTKGGECIPIDNCPIKCNKANEEYKVCGGCEPTCDSPVEVPCFIACQKGCFCKKGYVRDANGNCIRPEMCPAKTCGPYEMYTNCLPLREATCRDQKSVPNPNCKPGCTCMQGYVRYYNRCIPIRDCRRRRK